MQPFADARPILVAEGLWWRYPREPWLLQNLSLQVPAGGLLRVTGGNGSGKSTLLALLAGCARPSRGRVRVDGRPAGRGGVAYLPQAREVLPAIRADRLLAAMGGRRPPADPTVEAHLRTKADELSFGTAQRLLLEVVLGQAARLLVLDEPTAGLDEEAVERLVEAVRGRLAAGCAAVLVDHSSLVDELPSDVVVDLNEDVPADLPPGPDFPAAVARIVLRGEGTLYGQQAVGGRLALTVPDDARDAVLLEALTAGWSVLSVTPATAGGSAPAPMAASAAVPDPTPIPPQPVETTS